MDALNRFLSPILDTKKFDFIFSILIFVNPIALIPGVLAAFTAPSTEGISSAMFLIFGSIQIVVALKGVQIRNWPMFLSMGISAFESATIILAVIVRG